MRQLMRLVKQIRGIATAAPEPDTFAETMARYAAAIDPWATLIASQFVRTVNAREVKASQAERAERMARRRAHGNRIYEAIQREITLSEKGQVFRELQNEQVSLITSLPRAVAQRVQKAAGEGAFEGKPRVLVAREIAKLAATSESHARLIARTETSRAFSTLNEARARFAGSTHYRWLTSQDAGVRPTHARLNGQIFSWDNPPVCEVDGTRAHPGRTYNCRCVAIAVFPD